MPSFYKKILIISGSFFLLISCSSKPNSSLEELHQIVDNWHEDVAKSNFEAYFDRMGSQSYFIGTDANERWTKEQFMAFSKPYFDKKSTWEFTRVDRNIILDEDYPIAWFDEVLDTWMGLCRGSGVLKFKDGQWYLEHYVLSLAVPNDDMQKVIDAMHSKEDQLKSYAPATLGN